ncbi:MAG: peptide-methionine (S)-S-oxide reductase MsrA [Saprospiraceae bacterium]|jgi:peptide-methionine (S)-S-oxide reductase|uniref:peptide-methionine (S)-S-oxide reductase MsrA n=1 Tax=Candidatus Brachybacter algidus TaxID=2982024 RepID=UPI001B5B9CF7|nr:peptide-methionine (S)-S-oxide reductase MsrA [Candidatus Brachybacter algidus]MBP7541671.1 peptide-methionine (S)-S-oxide reductase MsrA [Saprospiraceae bacterium]MBK6371845.1 peptide-methionine (S)-S-oxide reductase MsrA [Candidatus Brachybacter algidus]MBK6448821.1 peptide-methionine (S)-S-oxide reductase MsrA [Candidatus Brachybacter algidus]MBK9398426.1 peptide-methionine (S)-S-oxide reductase MsrA [Candidatus Brachybacter algidus]MBL0119414.1 peptide-methionine (S)-S-oxide reductase M
MSNIQIATFGGGCFWCVEAVIQRLKGVKKLESGYSGGRFPNPTYKEVCGGLSGHAEVVQVTFDADTISYHDLITIFMTTHDPTTLNRQGADRGTQYRSVIYYHNDEQKEIIEQVMEELKDTFPDPIVTEVSPLGTFFVAEDYHQNYFNDNLGASYCRIVIDPKVQKLRASYSDKLKV